MRADSSSASPLQRSVARALIAALIGLLALQIVQLSIFNSVGGRLQIVPPVLVSTGAFVPAVVREGGATVFDWINIAFNVVVVLTALAWSEGRRRLRASRGVIAVTVMYGVVVAAASLTNIPGVMLARNVQTVIIPLTILSLAVGLPAVADRKDYAWLFHGVVALLVGVALASLFMVVTQQSSVAGYDLARVDDRGGRFVASGLFVHRNIIGSILEFGPALILYLMFQAPVRRRVWYWAAFAIVFVNLLLTFSRSSQLVAAISLLPLLWRARRRMRLVLALGVMAAVVALVVLVAVPEFRGYVGLGASLSSRPEIWRALLKLGIQHPWLGSGLRNIDYWAHGTPYGPHSTYLGQFVYFGGLGLALFLAVLAAFGRLIVRAVQAEPGWTMAFIVMLLVGVLLQATVEGFVGAPVLFANSLFWICVGFGSRPREAGAY